MTARKRLSILWNGVPPGTAMGGAAGFIQDYDKPNVNGAACAVK